MQPEHLLLSKTYKHENKLWFELANVMLLCCSSSHVMGHLCIYLSGRQRFNVISPGSRGTVYASNPSGEVPFLRRGMMIAVIINTALCNPS